MRPNQASNRCWSRSVSHFRQAVTNASPELWFGVGGVETFAEHNEGLRPSGLPAASVRREVAEALRGLGLDPRVRSDGTGLVVDVGEGPPRVGFRADLDAPHAHLALVGRRAIQLLP